MSTLCSQMPLLLDLYNGLFLDISYEIGQAFSYAKTLLEYKH